MTHENSNWLLALPSGNNASIVQSVKLSIPATDAGCIAECHNHLCKHDILVSLDDGTTVFYPEVDGFTVCVFLQFLGDFKFGQSCAHFDGVAEYDVASVTTARIHFTKEFVDAASRLCQYAALNGISTEIETLIEKRRRRYASFSPDLTKSIAKLDNLVLMRFGDAPVFDADLMKVTKVDSDNVVAPTPVELSTVASDAFATTCLSEEVMEETAASVLAQLQTTSSPRVSSVQPTSVEPTVLTPNSPSGTESAISLPVAEEAPAQLAPARPFIDLTIDSDSSDNDESNLLSALPSERRQRPLLCPRAERVDDRFFCKLCPKQPQNGGIGYKKNLTGHWPRRCHAEVIASLMQSADGHAKAYCSGFLECQRDEYVGEPTNVGRQGMGFTLTGHAGQICDICRRCGGAMLKTAQSSSVECTRRPIMTSLLKPGPKPAIHKSSSSPQRAKGLDRTPVFSFQNNQLAPKSPTLSSSSSSSSMK